MSRRLVKKYLQVMKKRKFVHGQVIYKEGEEANKVFFVHKGTFEQIKKLPHKVEEFRVQKDKIDAHQRVFKSNILAKRLPEIKDLPLQLKVVLAGPGTLIGEEDVFSRSHYTCSVKCYSYKGSLYELPVENFMSLKNQEQ